MNPTDEQIEEFWKFFDFRYEDYNTPAFPHQGGEWLYKDGHPANDFGHLPEISLDNIFNYSIPKLYEYLCKKGEYYKIKQVYKSLEYQNKISKYTPALYLFWSIWKIIHA